MADAPDSKSGSGNRVRVQVPPPALTKPASDAGFEHTSTCWGPVGGQKGPSNRARDGCRRHAVTRPAALPRLPLGVISNGRLGSE